MDKIPPELFRMIVRELVKEAGFRRAWRYRAVCQIFRFEIQEAVFSNIEAADLNYKSSKIRKFLQDQMANLLYAKCFDPHGVVAYCPVTICRIIDMMVTVPELRPLSDTKKEELRHRYTRTLCVVIAQDPRRCNDLLTRTRSRDLVEADVIDHGLSAAAILGRLDLLKCFLDLGADPRRQTPCFGFALKTAVVNERFAMVKMILSKLTTVNRNERGTRTKDGLYLTFITAMDASWEKSDALSTILLEWFAEFMPSNLRHTELTNYMKWSIERGNYKAV